MAPKPKLESMVKTLMTKQADTVKDTSSRKSTNITRHNVPYFAYSCPREYRCRNDPPVVTFPKGSGWRNPYSHLLSCVAGGNEPKLMKMYRTCVEEEGTQDGHLDISSFFRTSQSSTGREKAMYHYIDILMSLSLPLSYIENSKFRDLSKVDENISIKALRETMFKFVELVENSIKNDLENTCGAIMQDT